MFETEEYMQIKMYHENSNNFKSKAKHYLGNSEFQQTSFEKYVKHNLDIKLNVENLKKSLFSSRDLSNKALPFKKFNDVLVNSYYVQNNKSYFSPSAGNLLPIDMYVLVKNVENVKDGVYFYYKNNDELIYIRDHISTNFMVNVNKFAENANCIIVLAARFDEVIKKYRSRSYRFALLECGHIGQNFYINSQKYDLVVCVQNIVDL